MNSTRQASATTRNCARIMGPYLVIVTATAMARSSDMRSLLSDFQAPVWSWVTGTFVLLSGLVVVGLHRDWRGAPAITVSLLGWLTAVKGFVLMAFPGPYLSFTNSALQAAGWWHASFVVVALIGLYLTFVGWAPQPHGTSDRPQLAAPELPRAA